MQHNNATSYDYDINRPTTTTAAGGCKRAAATDREKDARARARPTHAENRTDNDNTRTTSTSPLLITTYTPLHRHSTEHFVVLLVTHHHARTPSPTYADRNPTRAHGLGGGPPRPRPPGPPRPRKPPRPRSPFIGGPRGGGRSPRSFRVSTRMRA